MNSTLTFHPKTVLGQILYEMIQRYIDHDVARDSAALTYYLLFSTFPLLIFISVLIGFMDIDAASIVRFFDYVIPDEVISVIESYLDYVTQNKSQTLLSFSLVFSIWFPFRAATCLSHSIRKAFNQEKPVNPLVSIIARLFITLGLITAIVLSLLFIVVSRTTLTFISRFIVIPSIFIDLWARLRFIALFVIIAIAVSLVYMISRGSRTPFRQILPGAFLSITAWMLVSIAFSYYVQHFAHYTELYGSIATIVVILIWLYMTGVVLIMGAEIDGILIARKSKISAQKNT